MKYTKQIIFFLFINLIIVFLSIFTANITRNIEHTNIQIKQDIEKNKEQLSINKIEFSYYNNSNYLKKLYNIYFSFDEENLEKKIVTFSNFSNINSNLLVLVNLKSKENE